MGLDDYGDIFRKILRDMSRILLVGGCLVGHKSERVADVLIEGERIIRIDGHISDSFAKVYDLGGSHVFPGFIDTHVHFRTPGMEGKGNIRTESAAAVAGGVSSFIDMPNTFPSTTTLALLEEKYALAARISHANYGFYLGATTKNIEELQRATFGHTCAIKVFMASSTGDLLVHTPALLEKIFSSTSLTILAHCEKEEMIRSLWRQRKDRHLLGASDHMHLRPREACVASTKEALALAKRYRKSLHVLHLTTKEEVALFGSLSVEERAYLSCEVCPAHLFFCAQDYGQLGYRLKVNPSIKEAADRAALWAGLRAKTIDIVGSDHAPHRIAEKEASYAQVPSGMPMVQHTAQVLLEGVRKNQLQRCDVASVLAYRPAKRFGIRHRGRLKEGYYADISVFCDMAPTLLSKESLRYHCGWSALEGKPFSTQCTHTWVSGRLAWEKGVIDENTRGLRLAFSPP